MFAWLAALARGHRSAAEEAPSMPDQPYWDMVLQNISDIREWLAQVELNVRREQAARSKPAAPVATNSVDDDVAEADSPTRVQKALEREFHVDRRTVYQRVERLVAAYQLDRKVPDWRSDVEFWKAMAHRDDSGKTRLERGLAALDAKQVAA